MHQHKLYIEKFVSCTLQVRMTILGTYRELAEVHFLLAWSFTIVIPLLLIRTSIVNSVE